MKIAYQGHPGSYAHLAVLENYPNADAVHYATFLDAIRSVEEGQADLALIPIDNSTMGRISDIHHLLPEIKLFITAEHYLPIQHCLLAQKEMALNDLTKVYSQVPALTQCRKTLQKMNLEAHASADTAGAAKMIANEKNSTSGALASSLAAEIYGLSILNNNMNDAENNITRFIAFEPAKKIADISIPAKTSLLFTVKSIPSALYKVLGIFAEEELNLAKLESYLVGHDFTAAQFYIEIEAHIDTPKMGRALKNLHHLTKDIHFLGCYPLKAPTKTPT